MTKELEIIKDEDGAKVLMLQKGAINEKQLLHILQRTPAKHIYRRKGKGGRDFDYITGTYAKKVLNYTFGWLWNFEIKNHIIDHEAKQCIVLGRLEIKNDKNEVIIVKEQFGRADIKYYKDGKGTVDLGNDLKAAATDALKKCASELGIASDVYGANEFKEIEVEKKEIEKKKQPKLSEIINTIRKTKAHNILEEIKKKVDKMDLTAPQRKIIDNAIKEKYAS